MGQKHTEETKRLLSVIRTTHGCSQPVEYQDRNPNMEIVHASVNTVRLNLSGSGTLVKSTRPEQVRVKLDLSSAGAGQNDFVITASNISLPPGLALKNVNPQNIVVDLDVTVKKDLPVQVDWAGRLPEHLILTEATVDPQRVESSGGKRILESLQTIYTEKVSLDRLREGDGVMEVALAIQPASLKLASGSNENGSRTCSRSSCARRSRGKWRAEASRASVNVEGAKRRE